MKLFSDPLLPFTMKYRTAYVTITAQVFVPEDDFNVEFMAADNETAEHVFDRMARERVYEYFTNDEPLKFRELFIDLSTFR